MHDFSCADADDIVFDELKKGVRHFKEEEGRCIMCKAVEEYGNVCAKESARKTAIDTALRMLDLGKYGEEEIALITGLKLEEVKELKKQTV